MRNFLSRCSNFKFYRSLISGNLSFFSPLILESSNDRKIKLRTLPVKKMAIIFFNRISNVSSSLPTGRSQLKFPSHYIICLLYADCLHFSLDTLYQLKCNKVSSRIEWIYCGKTQFQKSKLTRSCIVRVDFRA